MDIDDLKGWIIEKIKISGDMKTLNEIRDLLSRNHKTTHYASSLGDDFPMIGETEIPTTHDSKKKS
jgi:hypothetical protein